MDILMEMLNILKLNIPSIIAFIGIIISYFGIKRSYKNDLEKLRTEKLYSKTEELPFEILTVMHNITNNDGKNQKKNVEDLSKFMYKVIAYGSPDAVKIAACVQQTAYSGDQSFKLLAGYSLLVVQLKFDLTKQIISPEKFFEIKLNDYKENRTKIMEQINGIVDELNLKEDFKVKIDKKI